MQAADPHTNEGQTNEGQTVPSQAAPPETVPPEAVPLETPAHPEPEPAGVAGAAEPRAFTHPVSLSPSRASDFMTCPLLYRLRVIDKLPEPPSPAATRGTLIHSVLERLFDAPQGARTPDAAKALLRPQWERLLEERPEVAELFPAESGAQELAAWLTEAEQLLASYFRVEDPNRLQPAERELLVSTTLESGLTLRGYVDRIDVAPTGEVRVVDYKTGRAPSRDFEGKAMFQMKFYALVIWRERGVVPKRLQLMYLGGGGQIVTYDPDEGDLLATERKLQALWRTIQQALETGEWPANPNRLCDWCAHKSLCPAWGGTPPAYPLADTLN
ncbi:putative RecB family exonuclease [Streptacidiphilus sp. MAP12-33]|uniref:RecB family exonuclease n=1 Tax=Streptacidiphilus sp. MAP12-33 TaxID=3156266 RepID=UPI003516EB9D